MIEGWCAYASVNPQVVLTVLELDGAHVTLGWGGALSLEQRGAAIEALVMRLASQFYHHLYQFGPRSETAPLSSPSVRLSTGDSVQLPRTSSASFAVLDSLSGSLQKADFATLIDAADPAGFVATWTRLFPGSDPLDASFSITPDALPPDDLFQFPFPVRQTWWFNGAHNWNGNGAVYGKPYSSMDFFTTANSCAALPSGDWSAAAAAGAGYHPGGAQCWYRIDHEGGWTTSYYHLRNVIPNAAVVENQNLGTIACETCVGGFATSPHVHFSLLYNGAYVDLEGVKLSGWTVSSGNGDYQSGGLRRNDTYKASYSSVLNEGRPGLSPTPTPTSPPVAAARYLYPPQSGLIRICPVKLVAEVQVTGGASSVTFWAKTSGSRWLAGQDTDGSDGWQTEWDCQDALDGDALLSVSVRDVAGQEVVQNGAPTAVTIRKDCPDETYRTAFFANPTLDAAPASSWCKASGISYNWGVNSPGAGIPGGDNFSARFRGDFWFHEGLYRFWGQSDDGARVWVDRVLMADNWRDHPAGAEPIEFLRQLRTGPHEVRVDYYERAGPAALAVNWEMIREGGVSIYLPLLTKAPDIHR